ncbi:hypothetical protein CEUSTIGMA_g5810.t1 [Chlamydomonas eustigma]|uniref:Uncharacterized protein n=1 Tax=Chlamydomonas eustigma TaxID=1157962 RepID=A0A250X5N2_9CHLO|nr:hypothetical protein CEUSTIGMA_g5810.t1 [Chlamydomonas eustigma]|eukprot:GAX78368.1 hypothetical protein CEUSTIGMA_g5810.t1 [Chlamydomonas eustigma]
MARSIFDISPRAPAISLQQGVAAELPRALDAEDRRHGLRPHGVQPSDVESAAGPRVVVTHPEFIPPPGCFPAYKIGPEDAIIGNEGSNINRFFDSACHSIGPSALNSATLFLDREGIFDHLLYNYLFMCTVNKELAVLGLHHRMREILAAHDQFVLPAPQG